MINKFLQFFSLASSERKGVIVLLLIIFLLLLVQVIMIFHGRRTSPLSDSSFLQFISAGPSDTIYEPGDLAVNEFHATDSPVDLFEFDPNTVSAEQLMRMGVGSRVTRTWINYRKHGGKFRTAADIKKIYGMTGEVYERLVTYIRIKPETRDFVRIPVPPETQVKATFARADINLADSLELIRVEGIGPVLSGRIIKYRKLLGGFYKTEQLLEVYGFPDSLLSFVNRRFYADTANLRIMLLNDATEEVLRKHPYVGRYAAQGIIKYRKSVGRINSFDELTDNGLLNREQLEKVKKYLDI